MNGAYYVSEDGKYNSADELATIGNPKKGPGVARMHANSVMATQSVKLQALRQTRAVLFCWPVFPDVVGVELPSGSNIAMQYALPFLAQWDAFKADTDCITRSAALPTAPQLLTLISPMRPLWLHNRLEPCPGTCSRSVGGALP